MRGHLRFTTLELVLLLLNVLVFGGCIVLLVLAGPSVALILLTIGAAGLAFAKLARAWTAEPAAADDSGIDETP